MDRRIMCRQWMGVLVGVLACLAAAQGQTVYTQGADLHVGAKLYVGTDVSAADDVDSAHVGVHTNPDGYFSDVDVTGEMGAHQVWGDGIGCDQIVANESSYFLSWVLFYSDVDVIGKLTPSGGMDPPYVLYDKQTRDGIVEKVKKEVPAEKQSGAVLFFNADTHQLETYVPAEGKFYNLSGTVIQALPAAVPPATQYKPWYYLDRDSGQVKSFPKPVSNQYRLKSGYRLDGPTGQFIDEHTGQVVTREQAVEFYNAAEQTYYNLQGQPLRRDRSQEQIEYVTEYRFDAQTGEVKQVRRPVRQTYVLKEGFHFDKKTGQFVKEDTGEVVPREAAVELKQTPSPQATK